MFHHRTGRVAALITLLSTAALPSTGFAASYVDALPRGEKTVYTASLADFTTGDASRSTRTLDWRQPSLQLYFDLPPAERTSEIVLNLSADPLTRVSRGTPVQVQFNTAEPVPVMANGRGFEARISFDAAESRATRNSLRIIYPTPQGAECVTPAHGKWSIDLAASTLRISGRSKTRNMSLAEVEDRLAQPALAPKKVGLIARGPDGTDMQALAAQGISLRTPDVPRFSVTTQNTDFNIIMVKRDRLFDITDDPMILNSKGARIFVPKGRPAELIFTADTDAEILRMLEIFSTRELPNTRRPITSLGEIDLQSRLDSDIVQVDRKARLSDLGSGQVTAPLGMESWASGAQTYRFGVADPAVTGGEILLRLNTSEEVSPTSRVKVALNGKVLGAAKLDRSRKSVAFEIEPGSLNATSNVLSVLPDLAAKAGYSCPATTAGIPNFSLGQGSKLSLKSVATSPVTELSRLTATGGIFARAESYIALPRDTRDYQASLRVLGRLAKASGQGLTLADYSREADLPQDRHVLVIGPADMVKPHMKGAPTALKDALKGRAGMGDNRLQAGFERFASTGSDAVAIQMAAAKLSPKTVRRGGIAALYGAAPGRLTGVITAAPGESFVRSMDTLIQPAHWNAVQGGVARWNRSTVVMAQTAQPAVGVSLPKSGRGIFDSLSFEIPDIDWSKFEPGFDFANVKLPEFKLPEMSWPDFKKADATPPATAPTPTPRLKPTAPAQMQTADLRTEPYIPSSRGLRAPDFGKAEAIPVAVTAADTKLRGKFEFTAPKTPTFRMPEFGSYQDIKRETKARWNATKRWTSAKSDSLFKFDTLDDVSRATDRLQDRVKPAGKSLRATLKDKMPGKKLLVMGDRTVSPFGLILMLAFGLVLILMSMASPASRLGGRH